MLLAKRINGSFPESLQFFAVPELMQRFWQSSLSVMISFTAPAAACALANSRRVTAGFLSPFLIVLISFAFRCRRP
jgi:hypothetical protein